MNALRLAVIGLTLASLPLRADDAADLAGWQQKAAAGDAEAEMRLGEAYANGRNGLTHDSNRAYALFQQSAAQKNAAAMTDLGWCYENGVGVNKDPAQAFGLYKRAAEAGNVPGETGLGRCYAQGFGVARDPAQAVAWFGKAARAGDNYALISLGYDYAKGTGVTKDERMAFTCFLKAAYDNNGWAQFNVGYFYAQGLFPKKNPVEAEKWLILAAQNGYFDRSEEQLLAWYAAYLPADQLAQAQVRVKKWAEERQGFQPSTAALSFAADRRTTIPLEDVYNELVIPVTIKGHANLHFWIDTGASVSLLDTKTAASLGIVPTEDYRPGTGIGPEVVLGQLTGPLDLQLPGATFSGVRMLETSTAAWDEIFGFHVDGIIGSDLLRQGVLHVDYDHRTVELVNPAAFQSPEGAAALPLSFFRFCPTVSAVIENDRASSPPVNLTFDTGAAFAVVLTRPFVASHPDLHLASGGFNSLAGGVGGEIPLITHKVSQLKLDSLIIANPSVEVAGQTQGVLAGSGGVIGNEIGRRFDVTIDYPGHELYLKPGRHFADPFLYANTGLEVRATGPDLRIYTVRKVDPNSAGGRAGFKAGDILLKFDGTNLSSLNMSDAHQLFRAGGKHQVEVMRDGKPADLTFERDDVPAPKTGA